VQYKVLDTDQSSTTNPATVSNSIPIVSNGSTYVEIFGNTGHASSVPNVAAASYAFAVFQGA
jgi:hypothetical protein